MKPLNSYSSEAFIMFMQLYGIIYIYVFLQWILTDHCFVIQRSCYIQLFLHLVFLIQRVSLFPHPFSQLTDLVYLSDDISLLLYFAFLWLLVRLSTSFPFFLRKISLKIFYFWLHQPLAAAHRFLSSCGAWA